MCNPRARSCARQSPPVVITGRTIEQPCTSTCTGRERVRNGTGWTANVPTDWNDVYRRSWPDVVRFLYRKVWDAERARDLAQDAFVKCLDRDPENPRALLFAVAANLAKDEARTVIRRRKHLTLMQGGAAESDPAADPAHDFEEREQVMAVQNALAQLSDRDREVLLLWDAGLNYQEIAAQTGLSAGAIGTTLARARKRLVEAHAALEGRRHAAH